MNTDTTAKPITVLVHSDGRITTEGGRYVGHLDDSVDAEMAAICAWVDAVGVPVFGPRIRLEDAAAYLDRTPKTLRNWAAPGGKGFPLTSRGGRAYVELRSFAQFIVDNEK